MHIYTNTAVDYWADFKLNMHASVVRAYTYTGLFGHQL